MHLASRLIFSPAPALFAALTLVLCLAAVPASAQEQDAAQKTTPLAAAPQATAASPDSNKEPEDKASGDDVKPAAETPTSEPVAAAPDSPAAAPAHAAETPDTAATKTPDDNVPTESPTDKKTTAAAPADAAPAQSETPETDATSATQHTPTVATPAEIPTATASAQHFADLVRSAVNSLVTTEAEGSQAAELLKERAAIAAYYAERDYAPLWIEDGKPTDSVHAVMERLARAGDDGLDLGNLPPPVFKGGDDELAAADVALSAQVVAYGRQASGSRVDPREISALIGAKPDVADPANILGAVAAAGNDGGTVLRAFNPPQKPYLALRDKLAELRREARSMAPIPTGPALRVGMSDPRVPPIRARFGLDADAGTRSSDLVYDTKVAAAVADFQKANGIRPSGVLTARTVASLAGGQPLHLEDEIIANMERWRWMPRDLGSDRIDVNIPDFEATVIREGEIVSRNKVIVGKPDTPTPIFSNTMKFLIVNPYWNVPPSIIRKEMLPRVAGDPAYLSEMGFQVFTRHGQLVVRQPPGERNALGRIKFMFPNQYSVYLHDTPSRSLFSAARRAFSHGCVRVDRPFDFAQAVLGESWSEERLKRLVGGNEHYVYLPKPLPIHIDYFTAYVGDNGRLELRDDLYGYSRKVKLALGLEG